MTSNHYKCRYCGTCGFTKNSLYEHIKRTSVCSSLHGGNRTSRTRTRRTRTRTENVQPSQPSENNVELTTENTRPPHPTGTDVVSTTQNTCCVCITNKPVIVAQCGHLCLCLGCSNTIYNSGNNCPICRTFREQIIKVY